MRDINSIKEAREKLGYRFPDILNTLDEEQADALDKMLSGKNIFLTGKAGTGKSYVTNAFIQLAEVLQVNLLVTAPTGIAAVNIGGTTLHRAFHLDLNPHVNAKRKANSWRQEFEAAEIILIDEISMCRTDLFDTVAAKVLAWNKRNPPKQLIVIGDFFQLPPVVTKTEKKVMQTYYPEATGMYAFEGDYWDKMNFTSIVLSKLIRQQDPEFIRHLNEVRMGNTDGLQYFNNNCIGAFRKENITLCPTNAQAQKINLERLHAIRGSSRIFVADYDGDFRPNDSLVDEVVELKEGCRVMSLINEPNGLYYNGSLGTVVRLDYNDILVYFDNGNAGHIGDYTWTKYKYSVSGYGPDATLKCSESGSCTQIPLKLAYAVTIHKSQGQTYDGMNLFPNTFAHGQLYVALSRLRSIQGLRISREITRKELLCDSAVINFYKKLEQNEEKAKEYPKKVEQEQLLLD